MGMGSPEFRVLDCQAGIWTFGVGLSSLRERFDLSFRFSLRRLQGEPPVVTLGHDRRAFGVCTGRFGNAGVLSAGMLE